MHAGSLDRKEIWRADYMRRVDTLIRFRARVLNAATKNNCENASKPGQLGEPRSEFRDTKWIKSVTVISCYKILPTEMGDETLAKTLLIKRNARALCRHCFRTREDDLVILSCFASLFMFRVYLKVVAQSRGKPCHKFLEQLTRRDNHNVKEQDAGPKFWSLQLDFG